MTRLFRVYVFLCTALVPGVARAQCFDVGVSCQLSNVRTAAHSEADVMTQFEAFAKAEGLNCVPVPSVPKLLLTCHRQDGIQVNARGADDRVTFTSRVLYGLKGTDTLRVFNARLGNFLKARFHEAVEVISGPAPVNAVDRFSGTYLSESPQNFGTSMPGQVRIEVTRSDADYILRYFRNDKHLFTVRAEECDSLKYPIAGNDWTNANVAALCTASGGRQILYTEKGLAVPHRGRTFTSVYYSNVQSSFYAFRRVR